MNLRIPGPTAVPPEVLAAGAAEMINHRGPEFAAMIARTTEGVKKVFQTKNELATLSASGTGAMEAAVVNMMAPGEPALVITIGEFGDRFVNLVNAYGGRLTQQDYEPGQAADLNRIEDALKDNPDIKLVFITHNETSTGVTNPILPELGKLVHKYDGLLVVDTISSLSSVPVLTDEWDLDVVLSGSQKGWMTAPGLAFVSVNERAWAKAAKNPQPRFYFDLKRHTDSAATGQTPWTPAVSVWFQLDKSLEMMLAEGLESIFARHERAGKMVRDGVRALGLELLADEGVESNTVTAIKVPEGVDGNQWLKVARDDFDTVFAGGQGNLRGKIVRFGHLGYMTDDDLKAGLEALKASLERVRK
ncbi:MAG: alanine--glyoxylate aminotransferase family protein [Chloroflexi bacterium]|nr:alanine--glyoxylate aminotransferase family protein [Chloroflexota bacterium]MDA1239419.1 alanine--glyoxylate aminotransferase family protein [Chloroflexota bacterium]